MADRSDDCSSDQDTDSDPVEDPPLLVSSHRVKDPQQSTEQQRSGDTAERQLQRMRMTEPTSPYTRLPLVDTYRGFPRPIHILKVDKVRTCFVEKRQLQDNITRLDNKLKVRPDDEIKQDDNVKSYDEFRPGKIVRPDEKFRLESSFRPDDKIKPDDEVRPGEKVRLDKARMEDKIRIVVEVTATDDKVESCDKFKDRSDNVVRLDGIKMADKVRQGDKIRSDSQVRPHHEVRTDQVIRPNPLQSGVNTDPEGDCAMQGDIFKAAQSGDVQTLKNYLDLGFLPDLVDKQSWSILHHAASNGQVDVMRLLHSKGCCVNPRDRHGRTPLHHAASSGACTSISVLVEELGSEVNPVDEAGFTPLKWSEVCEQYAAMEELLRFGGGVSVLDEETKEMPSQAFETGNVQRRVLAVLHSVWWHIMVASIRWSPLKFDIRTGGDAVKILIKCGLDVKKGDETGMTALHVVAAYQGHQEAVSALVDAGCPIDVEDNDGRNALHYAAVGGAVKMIHFLTKCGLNAKRGSKTGETPLHLAAHQGHQEAVSALVDAGCPIDVESSDGRNALHYAAAGGAVKMIHFLIKSGLDVKRGSKTGQTALHVAAHHGHQEVVSTLVDAGCPIDMVNSNCSNALHFAAAGGAVEMIHFLIKCGLNVKKGNKTGRTALHLAAENGHREVVSALVDAGCPIDVVDSDGRNVLHWAAAGGAIDIIKELIDSEGVYNFNVNSEDTKGITPLHIACAVLGTQPQAACELVRHGALLTKVAGFYGTPLHQAAIGKNPSLIDDLLKPMHLYPENTNPLNVCDPFGQTPAFRAAIDGHLINLERLVANNCDIRVRSNIKLSIFENAILVGQFGKLQAIVKACGIDDGYTSQRDLLYSLQVRGLLDPSKLLILGAIAGDPLVIDSLSSHGEEDMFTEAAHQVWSDTHCRNLLDFYCRPRKGGKESIYYNLSLPSACSLTPLQIAVISLKYQIEFCEEDETEITIIEVAIAQAREYIQKLITHPVSKFTVNTLFHNGMSPLDVAQQFGLHGVAEIIESAGGRPGVVWADLPKEVQIPAMKLYCSEYGHQLSSLGPTGLAALIRVVEGWVGSSPQLQHKSVLLNQQTSADAVLHQKPTRKLLIKHVLPRVTLKRKWRNLCILLDLEEDQVPKCSDQDDDDDLYQAVLFAWLEQGSQVRWESLFDAVGTFETNKTVKEMMNKVLEELQPSPVTSPPTLSSALMPLPSPSTHGVSLNRLALHRSREAVRPHQRLMERYRDSLLKVVPAKELILKWYNHQLVSDEVYHKICPETVTPSTARNILFRYFLDHGSQESFEKAFCQIMVEEGQKGYPQAARLGRDLLKDLMT